jgi:competence protein ComEC
VLELTIYSVDHGSAAHLRTPDGQLVVFDAGASDLGLSPVQRILLRAHRANTAPQVDGLVLSHAHADHIRELEAFSGSLAPRWLYRNRSTPAHLVYAAAGLSSASGALKRFAELDATYNVAIPFPRNRLLLPGEPEPYLREVRLHFLGLTMFDFDNGVAGLNNLSLVTIVRFGNLSVVLPGDIEPLGQLLLLAKPGVRDLLREGAYRVLIAPHHGRRSGIAYGDSVYPQFVDAICPSIVIVSDVHGSEHTCPELYRERATGHFVRCDGDGTKSCVRTVLTTKTNDYIVVRHDGQSLPTISVP